MSKEEIKRLKKMLKKYNIALKIIEKVKYKQPQKEKERIEYKNKIKEQIEIIKGLINENKNK